jgi:hypothetical protein
MKRALGFLGICFVMVGWAAPVLTWRSPLPTILYCWIALILALVIGAAIRYWFAGNSN